ncbi:MAG TPA: DUF4286 family protein [Flavobacteriia bacterium]|jgi:hypothetical protein|nr:DUF4286 family protein [Flavobacteriia bacterium]
MYIYNVTINIDDSVHDAWLEWMKKEHIPQMLKLGKFNNALMSKVVAQGDSGTTYSVQYQTDSKETLDKYYKEDADLLRNEGFKKFGDKFVAFRTELDVVSNQDAKKE